jgi:hypothetical protein
MGLLNGKIEHLQTWLMSCWTVLVYPSRRRGEAILTACFVLNRVPSSKGEITPYEGWKGRKSALGFLCAWGCLAKVNVPTCKKQKLVSKTMDYIFLGYA